MDSKGLSGTAKAKTWNVLSEGLWLCNINYTTLCTAGCKSRLLSEDPQINPQNALCLPGLLGICSPYDVLNDIYNSYITLYYITFNIMLFLYIIYVVTGMVYYVQHSGTLNN